MDKNANDGDHLVTARDNVGEGWKIKAPFPCGDCLDSSRGAHRSTHGMQWLRTIYSLLQTNAFEKNRS